MTVTSRLVVLFSPGHIEDNTAADIWFIMPAPSPQLSLDPSRVPGMWVKPNCSYVASYDQLQACDNDGSENDYDAYTFDDFIT